ncbi:MAG TPA: glycosyltransferase family 9 protein [Patescibacteria group bacterium]|nr:glycosyltransferase family 9 protein [Patescibacteria group bacterium]
MAIQPSTILVYVGLDYVGDGLMKLPFLRALRAAYPHAHITWLAGKGRTVYAGVLAPLVRGLLDEVIEDAGIGSRWWELLFRPLPGRHFDLVIDTQRRVMTTLILKRLSHTTFISAAAGYWLSDIRPPQSLAKPPAMVRQILDLIELATDREARPDAPLALDAAIEDEAERRLPDGYTYVGLCPGAGGKHKCWPLENYIALAMRQAKAGRVPVFFLGPDERDWENEVRDAVPAALYPLDSGASPLLTIALGRRLAVAVANDSGAGHMMAAAEVPLISLFGPTSPDKFAPVTPNLTVIRAQEFGDQDMQAIPLQRVADAIDRLLAPPH